MFKKMLSQLLEDDDASVTTESRGTEAQANGRSDGGNPDTSEAPTTDDRRRGAAEPATSPDLDQVFDLLRNRRRRDVMRWVGSDPDPVEIGTLAVHLAAYECDKEPSQINSEERKRVYISLYQSHLPKMDDLDAIEYDRRSGMVELGPAYETFMRHLPAEPAGIQPPVQT